MRKSIVVNALIAVLTVGIVVGAFVSFQRKRSSFERIDFTFQRQDGAIIVKGVDPGSGAEQAGLRPGDRIWLISDAPKCEVARLRKPLRLISSTVSLVNDHAVSGTRYVI